MAPAKLVAYVKQQMHAGYSADVIKQSALAAGWKVADIESAIAVTKMEAPPAPASPFTPLMDLVQRPAEAITRAKTKNWMTSILVLLTSIVVIFLSIMVNISSIPIIGQLLRLVDAQTIILGLIGLIVAGFAWVAFNGYIHRTFIRQLGGKGGFYEAFVALSYGMYVPALGLFASAIITAIPLGGVFANLLGLIAMVIKAVAFAIGLGTTIRAFMELYGVDLLVVLTSMFFVLTIIVISAAGFLTGLLPSLIMGGLA
jgi:hypothetical protein